MCRSGALAVVTMPRAQLAGADLRLTTDELIQEIDLGHGVDAREVRALWAIPQPDRIEVLEVTGRELPFVNQHLATPISLAPDRFVSLELYADYDGEETDL
jgi:hypothetical protein